MTPSETNVRRPVEEQNWTFLLELQWWNGTKFIQRFHAWSVDGKLLWDQAWPLFELQQSYKRLRKAEAQNRMAVDR